MPHTNKTLKLTPDWDLQLSPEGNLIIADSNLAISQNCANEIRLWTNDAYFQQDNGIEWKDVQLGKALDATLLRSEIRDACLRVDGVISVDAIDLLSFDTDTRTLNAEITITTELSENVSFRV